MKRTTLTHIGIGVVIGAAGATALIASKLRGERYVVIDMEELKKAYEMQNVHR